MSKAKKRSKVLNKTDGRCAYCGTQIHNGTAAMINTKRMQLDHIIPKANFITFMSDPDKYSDKIPVFLRHLAINDEDHIDNLLPSCAVCNKFKDTYSLEQFRHELSLQYDRAFTASSQLRRAVRFDQVTHTEQPIEFYFEKLDLYKQKSRCCGRCDGWHDICITDMKDDD